MDKPIPPGADECCENGCSPCVWDRYYEALRAWEAQQLHVANTSAGTAGSSPPAEGDTHDLARAVAASA